MSVEPWIDACPRSAMMPPPGRPDAAEQQLQDGGRADVLHTGGAMRPADGVDERPRLVGPAAVAKDLGDLEEARLGDAADLLHDVGCVAREVALEDLEHAARVLERLVDLGRLPVLQAGAVRTVGLLARRRLGGLLALARGRARLHPLVRQLATS
jgi:hypothetical protein